MKTKIMRSRLENVTDKNREEVNALLAFKTRQSIMRIPQNAKCHVGDELVEQINSLGEVYYEREKGGTIPVEYLKLTDEVYKKLKENGISEVAGHWASKSIKEIKVLNDDEINMLIEALRNMEYYEKLVKLGVVKFDEIDLENKDIKQQLIDARLSGDVLDMPIYDLPASLHIIDHLCRTTKCKTVGDILALSENEILKSRFIEEVEVEDLKDTLSKLDLQLKAEELNL